MRGGYKLINFKKYALTSGEPAAIVGIYISIANSYNKATMISGLVVGDVEYPDFFAPFIAGEGNFSSHVVIDTASITIEVDTDDNVTVTVA